jgi:NAD(P)-dependent dehydrogenase (short-subunit alcohol dehydrogenase family)
VTDELPVAAISGAAGDLGRVTAARLADDGFAIAACGRSAERLDSLAADLGIPPDRFHAHTADLADPAQASAWRDAVIDRFGRADALIHLVGGWKGGDSITETSLADYDWLHDSLVRTTQNVTRAFHDDLAASPQGRFLIVSSPQALQPTAENASYAAAKAAAETWTLALADSLAATGSTANIIAVGAILTDAMRAESPDKAFATFTPAEDIAAAIAFICSPHAARMNGKRLALHP